MTDRSLPPDQAVRRLVAAYKLRHATDAERIGAQPETWSGGEPISRKAEERLVAGEDEYRLSPYPYPGLRSFDPFEGEIFFGREESVGEVQSRLVKERIVVVLGGSGSGKSSLVRAGLLPYLNTTRRIPGRDGSWYKAEFRPRKDPLGELMDALVDQWLLPLLELDAPGLAAAMGLPEGATKDAAKTHLREDLRNRFFDGEAAKPRGVILAELLDLTGPRLDQYDHLANKGLRVPRPSIMLLLDQFEEVFRPEISPQARALLLNLIVDLHKHLIGQADKGSLFLAITMRSEELHRCSEHRGLAEVVNHSMYLLELFDPREPPDRADLHRAIVKPARNVFDDWGLQYDRNSPDAPFTPGMPDWLLEGSIRSSSEIEHRPDQLPLLQHALQATWDAAIHRWSNGNFEDEWPTIRRSDLPETAGATDDAPDLGACLRVRVDEAAERAAEHFAGVVETSREAGEAALRAAFRALARRDDNGTWARRFAEPDDIMSFMSADSALARVNDAKRREALRHALNVFLLRGYLSGGRGRPYDISHEALIRNWPRFREWLREPEEVAYALGRVLAEVEPKKFLDADDDAKMQLIPADVAGKIAYLGGKGQLPENWAADQIASAVAKPGTRQRWGAAKRDALREVVRLSALADDLRKQAERVKQEEKFKEQQRAILNRRTRIALVAISAACIGVIIQTVFAYYQKGLVEQKNADFQLVEKLRRYNDIEVFLGESQIKANSVLMYSFQLQLQRDSARGGAERKRIQDQKDAFLNDRERILQQFVRYNEKRRVELSQINDAVRKRWDRLQEADRRKTVDAVVEALAREYPALKPKSRLRTALLATAAIPQEYPALNNMLREAIKGYPRFSFFRPPGASQVWGMAINPKNAHQVAVGDDNGLVWIWDPFEAPADKSTYRTFTATEGIVNGLAFSADGRLLAAAYRDKGAMIWDFENGELICTLPSGDSRVASGDKRVAYYGLAFHDTTLAVASSDGKIRLWDLSKTTSGYKCSERSTFQRADVVYGVAFSHDGKLLAAAGGDGTVAVWDTNKPEKPRFDFTIDGKPVMFAVGFAPKGSILAATGADGTGRIWDLDRQIDADHPPSQKLDSGGSSGGSIGQIAFSPDRKWIVATARMDGSAIGTDTAIWKEGWFLDGDDKRLFGVAFSPDSKVVITGHLNGIAGAWLINPGEVARGGRNELLAQGSRSIDDIRTLSLAECITLHNMKIPIFLLAESTWQEDELCRPPFLWSEPEHASATSAREVQKSRP
jgi:WD domain, G-beta repeat